MAKQTRKTHWTQTPAGRAKMSEAQKKRWATVQNGQPPPDNSSWTEAFLQDMAVRGARVRLAEIDKERTMLEQFITRERDHQMATLLRRARRNLEVMQLDVVGTTGGKATVETKKP